jgi:antibiotic biosynthesis monooxygenase (ABM) superfamily enzyme
MLLTLVIGLIIVAVVYWAATTVIAVLPLPDPIKPIALVLVTVICVLYVVFYLLLPLVGGGVPNLGLR